MERNPSRHHPRISVASSTARDVIYTVVPIAFLNSSVKNQCTIQVDLGKSVFRDVEFESNELFSRLSCDLVECRHKSEIKADHIILFESVLSQSGRQVVVYPLYEWLPLEQRVQVVLSRVASC